MGSNKYVAILRGINVGGKRKILMADLKVLLGNLGFENVVTYIQSGNVVYHFAKAEDEIDQAKKIEVAILKAYGFEVPVIVISATDMLYAFKNNPYVKEGVDINNMVLTFLKTKPNLEDVRAVLAFDGGKDSCKIDGKNIYLNCQNKYHETKLSNNFFEKKLKVAATTRNWKTVTKLVEMVGN